MEPDVVGALQVAHVVALDPQRRLAQCEGAPAARSAPWTGVVVGRPAQPVPGQVLAGDRGPPSPAAPAWRPAGAPRCPPARRGRRAASSASMSRSAGLLGDEHPARHLGAVGPVDLPDHPGHELGSGAGPRPSRPRSPGGPTTRPTPHAEDLHRRLERVLGQADHVEVLGAGRRPSAGSRRPCARPRCGHAAGPPARTGGRRTRRSISASRLASTGSVSPERNAHQIGHVAVVGLVVDGAHARPRAPVDVVEQARAARAARGA